LGSRAITNYFLEAYLYGFAFTNKSAMFRPAFLDGEWSNTGFPSFFPRAFLYKTPIRVLLLLMAIGIAGFLRWRNAWKDGRIKTIGRDLAKLSPVWTLILVYSAFSLTSHLNIGHRHLLPIYPALFIACGACAYFFRTRSTMMFSLAPCSAGKLRNIFRASGLPRLF